MKVRNRWALARAVAVLVFSGSMVAACGSGSSGGNEGAPGTDVVRVGTSPFLSLAGFYVANAKGYFKAEGITIKTKSYIDASKAVGPLVSGELDVASITMGAATFNALAQGAPFTLSIGLSQEEPDSGSVATNVSTKLAADGITKRTDFAKLKGKKIGVGAAGSVNQYVMSKSLEAAGLDPTKDVQWVTGLAQPDLVTALGQGQVDATNLGVNFAQAAEAQKFGPVVSRGFEDAPDVQIVALAFPDEFLKKDRDLAVRFTKAYLRGARDYEAARKDPKSHQDVVDILAKNTTLQTPEKVMKLAPWWPAIDPDGKMNIDSIKDQQDFWADKFHVVAKKVAIKDVTDTSITDSAAGGLK